MGEHERLTYVEGDVWAVHTVIDEIVRIMVHTSSPHLAYSLIHAVHLHHLIYDLTNKKNKKIWDNDKVLFCHMELKWNEVKWWLKELSPQLLFWDHRLLRW